MSHQLARQASVRPRNTASLDVGRRFTRMATGLLIAAATVWWMSPTTRAQQVVAQEALAPAPIAFPQALGAATFHNNTPLAVPPVGTGPGVTNSTVNVVGFPTNAVVYDVKLSFPRSQRSPRRTCCPMVRR